jgi:N-methylhydantoinase B
MGGLPGAVASVAFTNGARPSLKSMSPLPPGESVTLSFAGGGGYGAPELRDRAAILQDLKEGYISPQAARLNYGVDATSLDHDLN